MLRTEISEDGLSAIMNAASYDIRNPRTVTKKMLFERVQRAARRIGIEAPLQLTMFNRDTLTTDFTDGVIREVKYGPCQGTDSKVDLGYLVAHINVRKFTRGSFYVNRWAFTELKLREFLDALGSCGLDIQVHKPLGLVFYNENDIKKEERRIAETELTAIYR